MRILLSVLFTALSLGLAYVVMVLSNDVSYISNGREYRFEPATARNIQIFFVLSSVIMGAFWYWMLGLFDGLRITRSIRLKEEADRKQQANKKSSEQEKMSQATRFIQNELEKDNRQRRAYLDFALSSDKKFEHEPPIPDLNPAPPIRNEPDFVYTDNANEARYLPVPRQAPRQEPTPINRNPRPTSIDHQAHFVDEVADLINRTTKYKALAEKDAHKGYDIGLWIGRDMSGVVRCVDTKEMVAASVIRELAAVKKVQDVGMAAVITPGWFNGATELEAAKLDVKLINGNALAQIARGGM